MDGATLVVDVPAGGWGTYVFAYSVAALADRGAAPVRGPVAFTVSADGVPPRPGGTAPWVLAGVAAVLGMAGALVLTVRRWRVLR